MMNRKQLIILWIGIAAIVVMAIFPPWALSGQGAIAPQGYGFILNPPKRYRYGHINTPRLYVQWIMVAVVTGGFIVTYKDKKKDRIALATRLVCGDVEQESMIFKTFSNILIKTQHFYRTFSLTDFFVSGKYKARAAGIVSLYNFFFEGGQV